MTSSTFTALRDPHSIIEAAKQAATAGNYIAAEDLLREAAAVQEATLGPVHPDLANTLNNLGIVCEITDHPGDAERCLRRAVTIATAVFESNHPFVVTSRQNLRDFCVARGRPIDLPSPPPPAKKVNQTRAAPRVPRRSRRRLAMNIAGPCLMLAMIVGAIFTRVGSTEPAAALPREIVATTKANEASLDGVSTSEIREAASASAPPVVVRAQLCTTLDEWLCDPADLPATAGPLCFYSQVKSTHDTMIQHRWYHEDRLIQSVDLPIQASPHVGYRSFSRVTMDSESSGNWKVEIRTEDGVLLHEERFTAQ